MLPPSGAASLCPEAGAAASALRSLQRDSRAASWAQTSSFLLKRSWVAISWQRRGVTGDGLTSAPKHPVLREGRKGSRALTAPSRRHWARKDGQNGSAQP